MSVRRIHDQTSCLYFITFTCVKYAPLFETTNLYSFVSYQFSLLDKESYKVCGFVIMPNHVHFLLYVPDGKNMNLRIGTMKRFLSYEIVKRLKLMSNDKLLHLLQSQVHATDRLRGKKHDVFEPSFDARICLSRNMADQKLKYMHYNPCAGKWSLVNDYVDYKWSSAYYYEYGDVKDFSYLVRYEEYV